MSKKIIVGVTGASGAPYLLKLLRVLAEDGVEIHLCVSSLGKRLLSEELGSQTCRQSVLVCPSFMNLLLCTTTMIWVQQ